MTPDSLENVTVIFQCAGYVPTLTSSAKEELRLCGVASKEVYVKVSRSVADN